MLRLLMMVAMVCLSDFHCGYFRTGHRRGKPRIRNRRKGHRNDSRMIQRQQRLSRLNVVKMKRCRLDAHRHPNYRDRRFAA